MTATRPTSGSGNPDLDSEKSHSINFGFNSFGQKLNMSFSARYSFTNNSIESFSELVNDNTIEGLQNPTGKNVLYTTYKNMGNSRYASLDGYVNWNPFKDTRLYTNFSGGYNYMDDGNGVRNDGWTFYASLGVQHTLPEDWRVSLNMGGSTPWISLQGKGANFFHYSASVSKTLLDKRLSVSVFASNFFNKYKKRETFMESASFRSENWSRYQQQRFGISVSYRMSELKASVKKTARSISNEDVKGGGENGR